MKTSYELRKNYYFKSMRHCKEWILFNFDKLVETKRFRNGRLMCYLVVSNDCFIDGINYYFCENEQFFTKYEVINYLIDCIYDRYDHNGDWIY